MIKWNYYSKRRSISLERFITANNIADYEGLIKELSSRGILPPEKAMFLEAYNIANPPKVKPKQAKPKPKASPKTTPVVEKTVKTAKPKPKRGRPRKKS